MATDTSVQRAVDAAQVSSARLPRAHWILLLILVAGGAALRVYEFRGFGATDDAAYAQIAQQIAEGRFVAGTYTGPAVFPLRMGIIYPTALLFQTLGVSEWSMVLFPFILSLLSIPLAYVATSYFFGPKAGLIAAALWAFLPLDAFHATILVPDLAAAFFASLGIVAILLLGRSRIRQPSVLLAAGLLVGLLFGISWLCKESVVYLGPFCAFLLAVEGRKDWKRHVSLWAGVAVGASAVLIAEMLVYHRATGDWMFHAHETERNYRQFTNAFFVEGSRLTGTTGSYLKAVVKRLVLTGPLTIFYNTQLLYLPLLAVVAALHACYRRNKSFLVPAVWLASLVFMFNFASSSFRSFVPLVLFDRYLYPVMLPAIIMVAGFLSDLFFRRPVEPPNVTRVASRALGVLLVMTLLLVGARKHGANRRFAPGWADEVKVISTRLAPSDRLYTDILSINGLEFFWAYPEKMNTVNFEDMSAASAMQPGDYVLVNNNYLRWLVGKAGWWPTKGHEYTKPAFATTVPSSWEKIWSNGNAALYRVK